MARFLQSNVAVLTSVSVHGKWVNALAQMLIMTKFVMMKTPFATRTDYRWSATKYRRHASPVSWLRPEMAALPAIVFLLRTVRRIKNLLVVAFSTKPVTTPNFATMQKMRPVDVAIDRGGV